MPLRHRVVGSSVAAAIVVCAVGTAAAEPAARTTPVVRWPWPQLSYSLALGKTDTGLMAHMWIGAGVRDTSRAGASAFVLGGVEIDWRDRAPSEAEDSALAVGGEPSTGSGNETWLAARIGIGAFRERGMAPLGALYLIVGRRVGGPERAPTHRLAVGMSAPGLAAPLWCIGIPTMLEAGLDAGGEAEGVRGFVRVGFNF